MALQVKLTPKGSGTPAIIGTAEFFTALHKTTNAVNDLIVVQGVQYTLSSVQLITAGGANIIGDIDCSAGPNYPAGNSGDIYRCTVAGKIGGADGKDVGIDDLIVCINTEVAGDEATVGYAWSVTASKISNKNKVFVDPVNGNNATAAKYNQQRPYATAAAAEAVSVADDVINLLPGTYTDTGLGKICEHWILDEGVIFNSNSLGGLTPTWQVSAPGSNLHVSGKGKYIGTDKVLEYSCTGGVLYFEFEEIALAPTESTVILIGDYAKMFVNGKTITHDYNGGIPPAVGGSNGAISISDNTSNTAKGYFAVEQITSDYPRGVITVLENEGLLYMKLGSISGNIGATNMAVIKVENTAGAGGSSTIDLDYAVQTYNAGLVLPHVIYIDTDTGGEVRLTYRLLDQRNALEGSACLRVAGGVVYSKGQTALSKGRAVYSNTSETCYISGEFINSGSDTAVILIGDGVLKIQDAYIENQSGDPNSYGVMITGGIPIFDDVTIVQSGGGAAASVYAGAAKDVKVYSLYANIAMHVNITNIIAGGLLVVDTDVS